MATLRKRSKPFGEGWKYENDGWIYIARKVNGKKVDEALYRYGGKNLPPMADDDPRWEEIYKLIVDKEKPVRHLPAGAKRVPYKSREEKQQDDYVASRLRALDEED